MRLKIIKPGIMTSIQDLGRWEYRSEGVPSSGAMDTLAARIANIALGNAPHEAVIEFTYGNIAIQTQSDMLLAYSGEGGTFFIEKQLLTPGKPIFIPSGTVLNLVNNPSSVYTYLAVAGGWDIKDILGSKSTYITAGFGGVQGRALKIGDELSNNHNYTDTTKKILLKLQGKKINFPKWHLNKMSFIYHQTVVRVVPAHEFTWFEASSLLNFLSSSYELNVNSNRMGYQLDGPKLNRSVKKELLSTAVCPGTIQVTNDGSLMLLMADSQTIGGYPRIAQVAAVDLPTCAQLSPGNTISFAEISRTDAEKRYLERENQLRKLAIAVAMAVNK
ncbi:5-oxoprolinase subunit C family protein [Olivibacter domesticus]|uniref:Antagonist of KipI n=1 Tax=Olivibacter domesticus TaxID=407022 RepID=A0A1H7QR97_OLID1|nr:biotin-dependent carboxyltransferase family protein [Olivibacter domesticus]SEL50520.1 antagonist of KipI [Olivibacter domesticus]